MNDNRQNNNEQTPDQDNRVIETASATTSPDNADSGNFAYVLTALTLIVTVIFSVIVGGCATVAMGVAANNAASRPNTLEYEMDARPDSGDMLDEMFDQYYNDFMNEQLTPNNGDQQNGGQQNDQGSEATGTVSAPEALDFYLAPYYVTLDDDISANAYANTPVEVRDFVRNLLSVDREYSTQISSALSDAARDPENARMHLDSAVGTCAAAIDGINAVELPGFENIADTTVRDDLGTARTQAAHRYELIAAEIDVLRAEGGVNTQELWKKDDDVVQAAEDIASLITGAMEHAANNG